MAGNEIQKVPSSEKPKEGLPISQEIQSILDSMIVVKTNEGNRIKHVKTGEILKFSLPGRRAYTDMKFLLASMMVKQETCEKKIKLLNSCQVYPESDRIPDLFIRNSRTFSMFDDGIINSSSNIKKIVGTPSGEETFGFALKISDFLNNIQETQLQMAKNQAHESSQIAQK